MERREKDIYLGVVLVERIKNQTRYDSVVHMILSFLEAHREDINVE